MNNNNEKSTCLSSFLVEWGDSIIRAMIIIIFILTFVAQTCTVVGNSMLNTLHEGEKLVISNLFYKPKENDIIVFHQTGALNEPVVKRIIATPPRTTPNSCIFVYFSLKKRKAMANEPTRPSPIFTGEIIEMGR